MNKLYSVFPGLLTMLALVAANTIFGARPWPQANSDLPADPIVQWGVLDNGIRYVIMPWQEPPERVSLRLLVEAGWLNETDQQKGMAHFIEHMAFNGTRHFSPGEMVEYFQRLGMAFGADTNAHTWWRETVYKLELPRNEESLLRDGIQLLRDYADGMLLPEAEIEKEKGVLLSEYRDRNSAEFKASVDSLQFALPDSIISKRIDKNEDITSLANRQELVDFYEKWYTPDRMVLIVVGEVSPDQILDLFNEYFADMPATENSQPDLDWGEIVPVEEKMRLFSNAELPMANLEIYTRRKIDPAQDELAFRFEQIKRDLANAMLSRRFEKLSKEEGAPFNTGNGYDYRYLDFVRFSGVSMEFEPLNWREVMDVAVAELKRALEYGFSESELAEAKANLVNGYEEAAARAATRKSRDLSSALVRSVRDGEVFVDPATLRDILVPAIGEISLESVQETFRQAWSQEERLVNLSGNFETLVGNQFQESLQVEVEPPAEEAELEWAYADLGEPASIEKTRTIDDLDIEQIILSNGVRVNLKQTDYEANKIYVKASFGSGKLIAPEDKPGLSLMASGIFIPGGLGAHSADDIQKLTAGRTVAVEFTVEDNEFTLGGITNPEDLVLQLQLMTAYLRDPGYRPEARRLLMRQLDGLYSQLAHNPNAVMQNEVARFLASQDFRFGYPAREDLEARTTEEVKEWLADELSSSYLELAIVGDFPDASWETVVEAVQATFGTLSERADKRAEHEEARQVEFPRQAGSQFFSYQSDIPRAMALVAWPTTDQSDIFRARRLSVLGSVYSDRMRVEIREETGEAYSPYAYNTCSDTYTNFGVFRAVVGVEPAKADLVQEMLVGIGRDLAFEGIDEDELVRAIEPVKSEIEEYRRTNGYWLNSVLLRCQGDPERLDWARSFEGFWETITVNQINDLANTYLQPEDAVPIQVQPGS